MSGLTKDQLRNELITHGVELPSQAAKKEEYVRLYDKYVAPVEQSKGDFSSDDEDSPIVPVENKVVNMEQSLIVDGLDVTTLDDDDLFSRLKDLGATVGPIVDSTRKVYQKKLVVLMGGDVVDSPTYNGDVDEDEYSDSEEAEEVEQGVRTRSALQLESPTTSPPVSQTTDIRKRILVSSATESPKDEVMFDESRHTPSPRRSLRSVTSSYTSSETITVRKHVNNGRSGMINTSGTEIVSEEEDEQDRASKMSLIVRLLVKLLFLGLIIALILYIYQNDNSDSPFKAVEQYARQALEAAVGEETVEAKEGDPVEPPVNPPPPEAIPAH